MEESRVSISPYTCITCRVAFKDLEIQRQHYKSDWHRYNLKRKVVELPPVDCDEFRKRAMAQRAIDNGSTSDEVLSCKICRKNFSTKNQLENHSSSKKHKDKVRRSEEEENENESDEAMEIAEGFVKKMKSLNSTTTVHNAIKEKNEATRSDNMSMESDTETVDSDEWDENPVLDNSCLFCNNRSRSFLRNIKHMTLAHSFFIPDLEYCIDPRGLLIYLGEKIFSGYMCIWCNDSGKNFQSSDAARAHMIDKGHCKLFHEGESLVEYTQFYDYSSSYPDLEEADPDAEVDAFEINDSDFQLVLPSGNVIGHRSLARYYKQSLNPSGPLAITKSKKIGKLLSQYRALGWSESDKKAVEKKARDIRYMQKVQSKYNTKLQFKANKLQRYFRPQVDF